MILCFFRNQITLAFLVCVVVLLLFLSIVSSEWLQRYIAMMCICALAFVATTYINTCSAYLEMSLLLRQWERKNRYLDCSRKRKGLGYSETIGVQLAVRNYFKLLAKRAV
jgi:hypothetical protein